ncbi:hypothetical protein BH10ACT11_BH10ACT11_11330 [soil metagenome]
MRPTLVALIATLSVAATAAPTTDLALGDIKVPQIDLPTVKPPSVSGADVKPPSVDLQPTVDSATNAVNTITGGGGGGSDSGGSSSSGGNPGNGSGPPASPPASTAPTTPATPATNTPRNDQPTQTSSAGNETGKAKTAPSGQSADRGQSRPGAGTSGKADSKKDGGNRQPTSASKDSSSGRPSTLIEVVQAFSWTLFGVLLAIALLALGMTGRSATLARLTRKLKAQRGELTDDVGAMQMALLPEVPAQIGETSFSVAYRSAGPASGGDFHDVVELDDGLIGVLVGDACGHGRDALHTTALVHYTVRAYLEAGLQPREAIRLADAKVGGKLGGDFVTVLCAVYDPRQSSLTYATAGHPAPIVIGGPGDQSISLLTDPPIGVGSPSGNRQTRISVPEGCELCFFSDGLSEARTDDGELIGRQGLITAFDEIGPDADASELLGLVDGELSTDDDLTVVTLRPKLGSGTTRVTEDVELDSHVAALGELRYFLSAAGLDSDQAQRTQADAINRARGRVVNLRIHHGGDSETNWEFPGDPERTGVQGRAPHLELVMPDAEETASAPVG